MKSKKSIYVLSAIYPEVHLDYKKGHYIKNKNDDIKCHKSVIGVFDNVKKAECVIKKLVLEKEYENIKWNCWDKYFGFILNEHYINDCLYGNCNISYFESKRTYLSDGTLNYFSDCDYRCQKKFKGCTKINKNINKNDIALCLCDNTIVPVLIGEVAYTKEEWKKHFKRGVCGDYTDDSGIAFTTDGGHEHPFSPLVFPISCLPYLKINKKTILKLKKSKEKYYEN